MSVWKTAIAGTLAVAVIAGEVTQAAAAPLPTNVAAIKAATGNDATQVYFRGGWGWGRGGWGWGLGGLAAGAIIGGAIASSAPYGYYGGGPYYGYGPGYGYAPAYYGYGGGYGYPGYYGYRRVYRSYYGYARPYPYYGGYW